MRGECVGVCGEVRVWRGEVITTLGLWIMHV